MNTRRRTAALLIGGGGLAVLLVCCGAVAVVNSLSGGPAKKNTAAGEVATIPERTTAAPPKVETRTLTETVAIPFPSTTTEDSAMPEGTTKVRVSGVSGVKTLVYEVTIVDGIQTSKRLVREEVTKQPVAEVVAIGTRKAAAPRCDPNYGGACVPIASDVDCAGGSGNGPAYVRGPVTVIGNDIYDLDRDNDGVGCE